MKVVIPNNEVVDERIHNNLVDMEPWGYISEGKFYGAIVFDDGLSTGPDVASYQFTLKTIIDDFLGTEEDMDNEIHRQEILEDCPILISTLEELLYSAKHRLKQSENASKR